MGEYLVLDIQQVNDVSKSIKPPAHARGFIVIIAACDAYAAAPPTVSPPIIKLGWPTPTGTH
jgi:hypothetical protein